MSTEVIIIRENTEYILTVPTGERQEITLRRSLAMRGFIIISDQTDKVPPYTVLEPQINILGIPSIKRGRFEYSMVLVNI